MRILHVMAGNAHGGAETACIDTVLAMREAGHEVALATRANPRNARLTAAGIPAYVFPFGGGIDLYTRWALTRLIRRWRPDVVQTWMSRAAQKTPRWSPATGIARYAVVSRLGGYYKLKYFKSADYFTTITPDIRRYLIAQGVSPENVSHINNFAETEIAAAPADRVALGVPAEAPLLLALGRLHTAKAFDTLIRALADLPGVYLWIAGEGPQRGELEELIRTLGVGERVRLLGWRDDRAALFQASDICVFCSRYEPFGTVFVQSWAQKTPVIVSDADGPRQFVRPEEDGLMVPRDDTEALRQAIERLCGDPALRARLAENGYRRYLAEFTKESCIRAYTGLYERLAREAQGD